MSFCVGDIVRAIPNDEYCITTNGWVGTVTRVGRGMICVRERPGASEYDVNPRYFELVKRAENKEEKVMVNVNEIITNEERETLLNDMKRLLDEYDYSYTDEALNKIIDEWATNKANLIAAFKKHPNYLEGKFMIVFSHNFERVTNRRAVLGFRKWLTDLDTTMNVREFMPEDMRKIGEIYCKWLPNNVWDFIVNLHNMTEQYIDDEIADKLNDINPDFHARKGQKMSRVVNKLCTYIGFNNLPEYNREFAKYADGLNPLQITRHTVLSVNPLDYLTMSFGNSWASCHTIDKTNKRGMPNSYEGMYSSGTVSYMLDSPSMVFYTVDASYNGNDFWHEPKINRQMFHWGEEKLVQGRLYPQDNDGDNGAYTPYREVVQKIVSELFGFPNLWTVGKGTGYSGRYVISEGTHYKDYDCYDNCTLSRVKGSENEKYITVGHTPICIDCGEEHNKEDNICCCSQHVCERCGCVIEGYNDIVWIDGDPYCEDCTYTCDCCEGTYVVGDATETSDHYYVCPSCIRDYYSYCECCNSYVRDDRARYVESEGGDVCDDCIEWWFSTCDKCGGLHRNRDMREFARRMLCPGCYNEEEAEAENN